MEVDSNFDGCAKRRYKTTYSLGQQLEEQPRGYEQEGRWTTLKRALNLGGYHFLAISVIKWSAASPAERVEEVFWLENAAPRAKLHTDKLDDRCRSTSPVEQPDRSYRRPYTFSTVL
jgi:hypothetical protein